MQLELEKDITLDELRKKITKGEIKTKVENRLKRRSFAIERIQRKKRDFGQLINKHPSSPSVQVQKVLEEPPALSKINFYAKEKEEQVDDPILNKKIFKVDDGELLVSANLFLTVTTNHTNHKSLFECIFRSFIVSTFQGTGNKVLWEDNSTSSYRSESANYSSLGIIKKS